MNSFSIGNFTIANLYSMLSNSMVIIIKIIAILIVMYITVKIGNYLINKFVEKQENLRFSLDTKKSNTIGAISKSILKYTVYIVGVASILSLVLGPVSLTFAGISGVAIGFGTQSLIKDIINGFFILFEEQFSVGDYIDLDGKTGIVESIELRITKIRDFNGDLHIIPNGMIGKVTNRSRGDMRILVEIDIAHEDDVDKAIEVMNKECEKFSIENEDIVEAPKVLGVSNLKDTGVTIKIVGKAKSMTQSNMEMGLRKALKHALNKSEIGLAYPRMKIMKE